MKKEIQGIWIGADDLNNETSFINKAGNEFQNTNLLEDIAHDEVANSATSRRDFLKYLGFGVGAAAVAAGCDTPVKRAIPYVVKPEEIVPGVATYYASSFVNGGDYCPVLVKTREGRPIKIEGNPSSKISNGGTSARAQASVLSLYDVNRVKHPLKKNNDTWDKISWSDLDNMVSQKLASASKVRVLTNTILSPTFERILNEFESVAPNTKVITYDPVSSSAQLDANEKCYGARMLPDYHFDKAMYIVSFNADFLGTWISPVEFSKDYNQNRTQLGKKKHNMSRHIQVENHMSLTGSNADNRIMVKPSEQHSAVAYLCNLITGSNASIGKLSDKAKKSIQNCAKGLMNHKGSSLVVCGNNDLNQHLLVNSINEALGNVGHTLTFGNASLQRKGSDKDLAELINEINNGSVDVLILNQANPVYDTMYGKQLETILNKVTTKIALTYEPNESSILCDYVAPVNHSLESWGDVEAKKGMFGMMQPTIHQLFDTRQAEVSFLSWLGQKVDGVDGYRSYLKNSWQNNQFKNQSKFLGFQSFWDHVVQEGVYENVNKASVTTNSLDLNQLNGYGAKSNGSSELEISFFETVGVGNGQYSNNPWLQELPDPVARTTWGNYLAVPVAFNGVNKFQGFNDLNDGDLVELTIADKTVVVPVVQQFGQMPGTISLALGYGRQNCGFAAKNIGVNVNDCLSNNDNYPQYHNGNVVLSAKVGKEKYYSSVQYHHTMGVKASNTSGEYINADEAALAPGYGNIATGFQGALVDRSIIRSSNVQNLEQAIHDLEHERAHHEKLNQNTLYPYDEFMENTYGQGHHWGMHIDLTACTGCGACAVACMAENNVPVVGKKQVSRHQEMTWLRIDRYFYGDAESPNTVYQPMMCQHCDNAPCENVCPVNATNHSSEGLNQMAYNRCVGTRYCANNCPYKVRRFNWLDYTTADIFPANQVKVNDEEVPFGADNLTRMVLNPDVTVRSRGVIEKCSFCVQRIQEGKLTAKKEKRKLTEYDVKSACQTACPVGAITFGDINDKKSEFSNKWNSNLNYHVLEEVNTRSSVRYTMVVNNRDEKLSS